jgi:hypothetical protein
MNPKNTDFRGISSAFIHLCALKKHGGYTGRASVPWHQKGFTV